MSSRANNELKQLIVDANKVVAFTGAGISTESGIPDFRSPGGIWTKYQPIDFRDFMASEEMRRESWRRKFATDETMRQATTNTGHRALARLHEDGKLTALITQNIDGLHQRSGIDDNLIIEIHGNGVSASCLDCSSPMSLTEAQSHIAGTGESPKCRRCGGLVKSNVISFGQPMPQDKMVEAERLALACDLFVVLGSSLVVQPAASLPIVARNNGANLVIVNREPTPIDDLAHLVLHEPLGKTLQKALEKQKT